jgi:predicted MFS family arabinose efflux permease
MTDETIEAVPDAKRSSKQTLYNYYVLAILSVASFFCYLDRLVISVLIEDIKRDLLLNDTQIGAISGLAFALFFAIMGLPLARLSDTKSRPLILSVCLALWSAATAACGLARNFFELFLARVGVGVGEAACVPASHSLIADMFSGGARIFGISVFQAGGLVGMSAGLIFAAEIADQYGWRVAFFAVGAPGVLLAALLFMTVREPRARAAIQAPQQGQWEGVKQLLKLPSYRNMLIAFGCYSFASYGTLQWTASFLMRVHDMSVAEAGWWVGTGNGLGSITGIMTAGFFAGMLVKRDRRWELWAPALMLALACPAMLAMLLVPSPNLALAFLLIGSVGASFAGAVALAAIQSIAQPWQRATASAVAMLVTAVVGFGCGPAVAGLLSDLFVPIFAEESLRYALLITTSFMFAGAFFYFLSARTFMADKAD